MKTNGKTKQKGAHPNAKYKDSLFRRIFGGKDKRSAEWRLQLYNTLYSTMEIKKQSLYQN